MPSLSYFALEITLHFERTLDVALYCNFNGPNSLSLDIGILATDVKEPLKEELQSTKRVLFEALLTLEVDLTNAVASVNCLIKSFPVATCAFEALHLLEETQVGDFNCCKNKLNKL